MRRIIIFFTLTLILTAASKRAVTIEDVLATAPHLPTATWSPDGNRFVFTQTDTLYLYDCATRTKRELLPLSRLKDAAAKPVTNLDAPYDWTNRRVADHPLQWFLSGDRLLVSHASQLFVLRLTTPPTFDLLTDTAAETLDPKLSPDNRYVSFRRDHDLYTLEIATRHLTRLTHDGSATLRNAELDWVYPEELDLATAHWWSPDSRHLAYLQSDVSREPVFPHASLLAPTAAYEPQRFPKAGDPNATVRLGIVDTANPVATQWMELGDPAANLIARVTWLPDSNSISTIRLNRTQNQLDFLVADVATGASRTLIHEQDPNWLNVLDEPLFLPDRQHFIWESERTGFRHLYLYNLDGRLDRALTSGPWEVTELISPAYFLSTEVSPLERHLYRLDLPTGNRTKLTTEPGFHRISASSANYLDTFSNSTTPPQQILHNAEGRELAVITPPNRLTIDALALSPPELATLQTQDGTTLYTRLTKPVPFNPKRKYPVIVNVYGGPGIQTIHNEWTGINTDQLLASHGFLVWSLDNRGSFNRGHAFESPLYHQLGVRELKDQLEGIDHLKTLRFVDPHRIGIYGGSYGGFMTLNALAHAPDVFRAGVSMAPVTDWRNYDSIYTERYMGLPSQNPEAYKASALLDGATAIHAKLLLIHNLEDDNVHFANTLQMADALERANKQFRMLVYPQRTHGITGPFRRNLAESILTFFEESLQDAHAPRR